MLQNVEEVHTVNEVDAETDEVMVQVCRHSTAVAWQAALTVVSHSSTDPQAEHGHALCSWRRYYLGVSPPSHSVVTVRSTQHQHWAPAVC